MRVKPSRDDDFGRYLMRQGVVATVFTSRVVLHVLERPRWSVCRSVRQWRDGLYQSIRQKLSPQTFALFSSLFLGNRKVGKKELDRVSGKFRQWGVMHYLARSGLHLVIFAAAWTFILRFVPVPLLCKQIVLLLLAILYALFSWSSLSFARAFAVFLLYQACVMARVPFHFIYLLTLVCFVLLVCNPVQLLFLDFQLSFGLTFALGWFNLLRRCHRAAFDRNRCSSR